MKTQIIAISVIAFAASSCDKARNLVGKAQSAVASEIAKQAGESASGTVDEELQKLVDQTPEGVVFRKDLPFPAKVHVKTTTTEDVSGRLAQRSEIGKEIGVIKGVMTNVSEVDRDGGNVTYTLVQSTFTDPAVDGNDPVAKQLLPTSKPATFKKSGSSWKAASMDFHTANLALTIGPVFDELLVENAVAPRNFWFGAKRVKVGDEFTVSGDSLPMVVGGKAKGSIVLKLLSFDAVNGHPCGVFSASGSFSRSGFPDFDGSLTNEDVTIESGKLWFSLLYPVILREETEVIQTIRKNGNGGLSMNGGGKSKNSLIREWKAGQR